MIIFFIPLCICFSFFSVFIIALPQTFYEPLPAPFALTHHLYFDANARSFLVVDNPELPSENILKNWHKRGFKIRHSLSDTISSRKITYFKGTTLLLMEYPTNYFKHFFHLLEHLVGLWAFGAYQDPDDVEYVLLAGSGVTRYQQWEGVNEINKHILQALFPNARILTWKDFISTNRNSMICMEKVFSSDRAISAEIPECINLNKHLGLAYPSIDTFTMRCFADKVHAYALTGIENHDRLRITYVTRKPPRCLDSEVEASILDHIQSMSDVELHVVDFAKMTFHEQIRQVAHTDILMGVHGNGLSHLLFLPPHSSVIELFPPDNHHLDYRVFAATRGVDYYGILYGESHFIEKQEAYKLGSYGNPTEPLLKVDSSLIYKAIDQHRFKKRLRDSCLILPLEASSCKRWR